VIDTEQGASYGALFFAEKGAAKLKISEKVYTLLLFASDVSCPCIWRQNPNLDITKGENQILWMRKLK
jgi:hypothetical protein